ncbi:MAG TPA: hypothetical protein VFF54_01295 [Thermodesulfobacteriota bacterium]|nr:hypothetical protein [Thermodesulfobacteriota bacterium]
MVSTEWILLLKEIMTKVIVLVLGIATVLGGIAAVGYFRDKRREKQQWTEKEKEVNNAWWESSELKKQYEAKGCKDFSWSNSERVAERIAGGKEAVYEIDEDNRVRYRLVNKSGQLLLCRKSV